MTKNSIKEKSEGVILVVDDEDYIRTLLKEILTKSGFEVVQAVDGTSAIEIAREVKPDLILLDIRMPGIDGYETFERLQKIKEIKDVPVMYVSAQNDEVSQMKGLELGSLDYIEKPFNSVTLVQKIRNHVKKSKEDRESKESGREVLIGNDKERKNLEKIIVEDICQKLVAINMIIEPEKTDIKAIVYQTLNELLDLAYEIYPLSMRMGNGIVSALKELSTMIGEKGNISCNFACLGNSIPDHFNETALNVYRIVQGSILNALIYFKAQNINIYLTRYNSNIIIKIEYDGLILEQIPNYNDLERELEKLRYRADLFYLTYALQSKQDGKTTITITIPFDTLSAKQEPAE